MKKAFAYGYEDARASRPQNPYFNNDSDYLAGYFAGYHEMNPEEYSKAA